MTKVNSLILKGCHVPLTAFYRPVKAVTKGIENDDVCKFYSYFHKYNKTIYTSVMLQFCE